MDNPFRDATKEKRCPHASLVKIFKNTNKSLNDFYC